MREAEVMSKRNMKKGLKAGILYAAFFIAVWALAAELSLPTIPMLGGGEAEVAAPNVTQFHWVISDRPPKVAGAVLKFDGDLASGTTIYLSVLDDSSSVLASGTKTLTSDLPQGDPVTVNLDSYVLPKNIYRIAVAVVGS